MRTLRAAVLTAVAAGLIAATPPPPDLHGPLSDFWARVKRDWSRRLTSLNRGDSQTAIWVAMIWDGPDNFTVEEIAAKLLEREARRWVRAQITKNRYTDMSRRDLTRLQALRQNLILLGTPEDNKLVARALEATPLRVGRGYVAIGRRRLNGDGLLLFAIAPNPIDPNHYALVITGSTAAALLQAGDVPYGDSDYIVFRGRKTLERGFFDWSGGAPGRQAVARAQSFADHFNWITRDAACFRLHFDPALTSPDAVVELGHRIDEELNEAAAFYGIPAQGLDKIDLYLYASLDRKVSETADPCPVHIDLTEESVHLVWSPAGAAASGGADPYDTWDVSLPARVLLRRSRGFLGESGERELPGLAMALSLASRDTFQTVPLATWAARSSRDTGYQPMDLLFLQAPRDLWSGDGSILDAAAFIHDLILREGVARVALFCRTPRRSDFREKFKEIFGLSIGRAEERWLATLAEARKSPPAPPRASASPEEQALGSALAALRRRDDREAERLLTEARPTTASSSLLARIYFRTGRFAKAGERAASALEADDGSPEDRAWARLTLGRARAMLGATVAAAADLKAGEIASGPEPVRVIADFWLEHLGQSLNGRAVHEMMMQQASADLMNFDWDSAEAKLNAVLAADPQSREAHAALGQVYLSKYQYWHDRILLNDELLGMAVDPEFYGYLSDKGRKELKLAESLPAGEKERWMTETGPVEPGVDQPMTHLLIGRASMVRGDLSSAKREIETALSLEPINNMVRAFCHLYLARIAAAAGDRTTARAEYAEVLKPSLGGEVTKLAKEEMRKLGPP